MLQKRQVRVAEERSTRKDPLTDTDARALLGEVDEVRIVRGRTVERRPAKRTRLADLKGPTGNYRSPMVRRGRVLLVGFQPDGLDELLGR